MLPAYNEAVALGDKVKAELLDYLYKQPEHGAHWSVLYWAVNTWPMRSPFVAVVPVMWELAAEGKVKGSHGIWYLTTSQWLAMTVSRQSCSTCSTSTQPALAVQSSLS